MYFLQFNLSRSKLLTTSYRNQHVISPVTGRPALTLGPVFLTQDASLTSMIQFTGHLAAKLQGDIHAIELQGDLVIGKIFC